MISKSPQVKSKKKILIIILPAASATREKYANLLNNLDGLGSIMFVDKGYFGLGISNQNDLHLLSVVGFFDSLEKKVSEYIFDKLIIVAGSVGAIHAIHFSIHSRHKSKIDSLILGSPAFTKDNKLSYNLKVTILNILLIANPKIVSVLTNMFRTAFPKMNIFNDITNVESSIGTKAYLLCLKELVKYSYSNSSKIEGILRDKAYTLAGKYDMLFEKLCDKNLCQRSEFFEYVHTGHSVLINKPEVVRELVSKRIEMINSNL